MKTFFIIHFSLENFQLKILVDGKEIRRYPFENNWMEIQKISGDDITLMIKEFHFEVRILF